MRAGRPDPAAPPPGRTWLKRRGHLVRGDDSLLRFRTPGNGREAAQGEVADQDAGHGQADRHVQPRVEAVDKRGDRAGAIVEGGPLAGPEHRTDHGDAEQPGDLT